MGWQPIETAPKDTKVLVYVPRLQEITVAYLAEYYCDGDWGWHYEGAEALTIDFPVTHWMPLPAPPQAALSACPQPSSAATAQQSP